MGKKDAKVQKKAQQEQQKVDKKKQEQKKKVEEPESDSEESSSEEEKPAKVVAQDSSSEESGSESESDSESEAEQKNSNGKRPLETSAQPAAKKQKTETGAADANVPEVFVGNLPQGVTEEEVSEFFGSCGEIVKVRILGAARPNAFLQFASQDGVNASLEMNGSDFNGNSINIEVARKKGGAPATGGKGVSCFIGNLSFNSTTDSIREFFSDCGNVVDVRIITDKETGRMKGFGYVDFDNVETAQKAVAEKNGQNLDGRDIRVDLAESKQGGGGGGRGGGFGGGFGGRGGGRGGGFGGRGGGRGGGFGGRGGRDGGFGGRGGGRGGGFGGRGGGRGGGFGGRGGGRGGGFGGGGFSGSRTRFDE